MKNALMMALIAMSLVLASATPAQAAEVAGQDENGKDFSCPQSHDQNQYAYELSVMLASQKTCGGVATMFEVCGGPVPDYSIVDFSDSLILPTCEKAIRQEADLNKIYLAKSSACAAKGTDRESRLNASACQRKLSIELGSVAELK